MTKQLDELTFAALTEHSFSCFNDEILTSDIGKTEVTYSQAQSLMHSIQDQFKACGIKQGDRVAICSENHVYWGVTYLAIVSMGAIVVPILPDFHSNEVHHIIKHCEAVAIFTSKKQGRKLDEANVSSSLKYVFSMETQEILEDLTLTPSEFVNDILSKGNEQLAKFKAKALEMAKI